MKALEKIITGRKQLAFLDLEGTQFSHEMIAIGCVKVDIRKDGSIRKIHKGYHSLVIAKNKIGKVVTDLTGITEQDLKANGKPLRVVVQELKKYLGSYFTKTLFVTFGSHDNRILGQSCAYNMDANEEDLRIMIKHNFDLSEFVSQYVRDENNNTYSLDNMLKLFNVEFEGTKHDPLYDALNLAYLYDAVIKNKPILCEQYRNVLKKMRHLPQPLHEALIMLLDGKVVTPKDLDRLISEALD
ncbi:MAG: exonuclease domain-containing protein [Bacilli bacterium]|nr:exonuclease domain-containing protein [Bacilli bacterium]